MFAEISASITLNSNCSINAKIFDAVDCSDSLKMNQLRNALKTLVQGDMAMSPRPALPKSKKVAESDNLISESQVSLARKLLRENNINEEDFCRQHAVETLEKMPKEEARQSIGDLINLSNAKHPKNN